MFEVVSIVSTMSTIFGTVVAVVAVVLESDAYAAAAIGSNSAL